VAYSLIDILKKWLTKWLFGGLEWLEVACEWLEWLTKATR